MMSTELRFVLVVVLLSIPAFHKRQHDLDRTKPQLFVSAKKRPLLLLTFSRVTRLDLSALGRTSRQMAGRIL